MNTKHPREVEEEREKQLAEWRIQKEMNELHKEELYTEYITGVPRTYTEDELKTIREIEGKYRRQLLDDYAVFAYRYEKDKTTGKEIKIPTGVNCPRLAKLLMEADDKQYIVTEDNQEIYVYNGSYYQSLGKGTIENRVNYYLDDLTTKHRKQEVVDFIKNYEYVKREELNPSINLINVRNGIFNIDTGELIPHSPEYHFLSEIPITYTPEAKIDKTKTFFESLLNLNDIPLMQEFWGDCLLRDYIFKKALMNVGPTDTGKSKLLQLLGIFLGEYNTSNVSLHDLCKDKYGPVELYGRHANICADIGSSSLRQVAMFLQLTGNDMIRGQKKYGQPFNFRNYAKLVFSCNLVPDTEVKTDAYYGRWLVLEYSNVFDEETKIPNIIEDTVTEKELSGLFNWTIEGLLRLRDNKGYSPHRSLEEVREYMQKGQNPIREFVDFSIRPDPKGVVTKEYVYKCYKAFCEENDYPIKEGNVFSRKFKPLIPTHFNLDEGQQLKGGKRTWKGIKCIYDFPDSQQKVIP